MRQSSLVNIIKFLIFVVVIGTPLFYLKAGVYPYTLSKTLFFQAAVEILFFFWLLLIIYDKRYRPKRTPLTAGLIIFVLALLITSFFGADPSRSFWSTYERTFGVVAILHLAAFAFVLSSLSKELNWRKLFYTSLGTALFVTILALLQLKWHNLLLEEPGGRPGATFGNPTFLAGYLLFNIFIGVYLLFSENKILRRIILTSVIVVSIFGVFVAETRGDILGLGVALGILVLFFAFRPPEVGCGLFGKRLFYGTLFFIFIALGSVFWLTRSNIFWSKVPGLSRFRDISLTSEGLQPRLIALRAGWRGFLERPFFGWGPENFNIVFNKYYDPRALELGYTETRFDKPHNFLIEDLTSGGLLLAFAHLVVLGLLIFEASRLKDKLLRSIVAAATAGYVVRSLFIFDTLGPALMLFIVIGFVDGKYRIQKEEDKEKFLSKPVPQININSYLLAFVSLIAFVVAYQINVPTMQASYNQYFGFIDISHGRPNKAIENFHKALDSGGPYRWNFARDFAAVMAEAYFYNPDLIPKEEALRGIREMERVAAEHPLDAYNHYALVDMYNQVSDLDLEKFLEAAEREAAIALKLSPDRQEIYFSLAKTKTLRGDYTAAINILEKALELDEKVPDAHFYYGIVSFAANNAEVGYRELKTAITMGRPWKNFYEPRTVAHYFADSGHLDEAIELYKTALGMQPDDLETKIKLGAAYFFAGDYASAKKYLEEAGKKFDFKKSPSYGELKLILDKLGVGTSP